MLFCCQKGERELPALPTPPAVLRQGSRSSGTAQEPPERPTWAGPALRGASQPKNEAAQARGELIYEWLHQQGLLLATWQPLKNNALFAGSQSVAVAVTALTAPGPGNQGGANLFSLSHVPVRDRCSAGGTDCLPQKVGEACSCWSLRGPAPQGSLEDICQVSDSCQSNA